MKKNTYKILSIFIIIIILLCGTCYAIGTNANESVSFSQKESEYIKLGQVVFVAGNSNLFPIEYYSKDNGKFCGIIPDYLDIISEMSGITFKYINEGKIGSNLMFAKDKQVEIVSAYEKSPQDTIDINLIIGGTILKIPDSSKEICFAYTDIAPPELISIIEKCIEQISQDQRENIFLKNSLDYFNKNASYKSTILILFAVCSILVIFSVIIILKIRKQKAYFSSYINSDEITGFDNCKKLKENFEKNISIKGRINYWFVSIGIDIETIVDIYGYEDSTQLIKSISEIIKSCIKDSDFFAVTESAYLLLLLNSPSEAMLNERLHQIEEKIAEYSTQHKNKYNLNPSMGVCQLSQQNVVFEEFMYRAVQARKYAESTGSSIYIFNKTIENRILEESQLEKDILNGLLNNEFVVYLQPYFNLHDKSMHGCEALVRWKHSKRGLLKPNSFIHILENKNLIDKLDLLMFENICKILENRKKHKKNLFWISCNFSKQNFSNPNFAKTLLRIALSHNIHPEYLLIEITEGLEIGDTIQNNAIINQLNEYGFPLVIDNFGSGYSSFTDLAQHPISFVKLDRKLVKNIESENVGNISKGLLTIMHDLNIKVMCNGIESKEQAEQIIDLNFDYVQGHFFYYPIYHEEFEKLYDQGELTIEF